MIDTWTFACRPHGQADAEIENIRGHTSNQTGSSVWDRMLGDEAEQQEEDCYHGDEDVALDRQSDRTGSHAKLKNEIRQLAPIDEVMRSAMSASVGSTKIQTTDSINVTRKVMDLTVSSTRRRGRL